MFNFPRVAALPPYIFKRLDELKAKAISEGQVIYDFGMGNPDGDLPKPVLNTLIQEAKKPFTNRYAESKGILELRESICQWYDTKFGVKLNPNEQACAVIGSKEGLAHLAYAMVEQNDVIVCPNPTYPIHYFGFVLAGATIHQIPLHTIEGFTKELEKQLKSGTLKPKALVINFPSNPTTLCATLNDFEKIIKLAKKYQFWVIHDLAYGDISFDQYKAPSILQVKGAMEVAVETYTLSKTYNMAGLRVGFVCGNATLVGALIKIKSYLDYGIYEPIQKAAVQALLGNQKPCIDNQAQYASRRDVLCRCLSEMGWDVPVPKATMFVWAKIPKAYEAMGSLAFCEMLVNKIGVVVSPGIGFGSEGDGYVRFALIQPEANIIHAMSKVKEALF